MPEVVLVGHGMGGLLAKLQVTWSGDSPWKTVSNRPLEQIVATPTDRQQIARITYVAPAPRIRRVVYIYLNDWKFGQLSEVIDEFVHLKRTFFKRESR